MITDQRVAVLVDCDNAKTPDALRGACERFFEFVPLEQVRMVSDPPPVPPAPLPAIPAVAPVARKQPAFLIQAVSRLAAATPDGRVHLGTLGNYLAEVTPGFSSKGYGYPKLIDMLRGYASLELRKEGEQAWTVRLKQGAGRKAA